jgi:DNA-binding MarR family transcriptional regulator
MTIELSNIGVSMSKTIQNEKYQIIWLIRRLFRSVGQKESQNLELFDISLSQRAVMEFLYLNKELSVPQIAQKYQVSRQHIQSNINSLLEKKLIDSRKNPKHKKSDLFFLNKNGQKLFEKVLDSDKKTIDELFSKISDNNIQTTKEVLNKLFNKLKQEV